MPSKNSLHSYGYLFVTLLASIALSLIPLMAQGEDKHWIGESDYWTTDINWDPIGTPQNGDNVHIIHTDSINRNIHYPHEPIPELDLPSLEIDNDGDGHTKLIQEENSLNTNHAEIGILGSAQWDQNGGSNFIRVLDLGLEPTGVGTYILENDAHLTTFHERIGYTGAGEFIQLGGTNNVLQETVVPWPSPTAYGYYEISSGSFNSDDLYIGLRGVGHYFQTGGNSVINSLLTVGGYSSSGGDQIPRDGTGLLELFDGSITSSELYVGTGGSGAVLQAGGTNTVTTQLTIGSKEDSGPFGPFASGTGVYILDDGELTTPILRIGQHGEGTFIQTGGEVTAAGLYERELTIDGQPDGVGQGEYILESGILTSEDVFIGANGPGTFTQNGGLHFAGHNLMILSGAGVYNLNAGTLNGIVLMENYGEFNFKGGELSAIVFFNHNVINLTGTRTFTGDLSLRGTLNVELKNHNLSDNLTVRGDTFLHGNIKVTLAEGFEPNTGDTFDILTTGYLSGFENATFELPELPLKEIRAYLVDNTIQLRVMSGNFDDDNDIDFTDFMIFAGTFGLCEDDPGYLPSADYDADGCITFLDYSIWFGYFQNQ